MADDFSEKDLVVERIKAGDLEGLKDVLKQSHCDPLVAHTLSYQTPDVSGPLIHIGIYYGHSLVVCFLFDELVKCCNGSVLEAAVQTEPTFFALKCSQFMLILKLLKDKGLDPNQQRAEDSNILLYFCCDRKKPPLKFIKQLLQTKGCDVNLTNKEGDMALHLLARKCAGPDGRDVITMLKIKGARLDARGKDGKTASESTFNPHIRDALSLRSTWRRRELPKQEELAQESIDDILKTELQTPRELYEKSLVEEFEEMISNTRSKKKLTSEEQEDMANRLVKRSMDQKQKTMDALLHKYVTEPERTVLSAEELESFTNRHYYDQVEAQNVRQQQLMEKYVTEMVPSSQLTEEDMQNSVQRLYVDSMTHTKETAEQLTKKYISGPLVKCAKKPKAQIEQAVVAMYQRSMEASKKHADELTIKYELDKSLVPSKKLTKEEIAAMGDRLSKSNK